MNTWDEPEAAEGLSEDTPGAEATAAPLWFTEYDLPATVRVPERGLVDKFAATEYPTVPLEEPGVPEVIVSHPALLVAVHPQPFAAVTVTLPLPAAELNDCDAAPRV